MTTEDSRTRWILRVAACGIVIAAIAVGMVVIVLEVWDVINVEVRNKILLTTVVIACGVLLMFITYALFFLAVDDGRPAATRGGGTAGSDHLSDAFNQAKIDSP